MAEEDKSETSKTHLSHATSLPPLNETPIPNLTARQSLKRSFKRVTGDGNDKKAWSFGSVAKAVGCGVTALGTGVVQGSKAVGSGVVQGSMAVGSGVVTGTKAVGTGVVQGTMATCRATKDVTMAAGKGVYQAGEMVGSATVSAGKAVGTVSANAVSDTTKWVTGKRLSFKCSNNNPVHVVLPGETLEQIANKNNVPVIKLIKINRLDSRHLRPGKQLYIDHYIEDECGKQSETPRHSLQRIKIDAILLTHDDDYHILGSLNMSLNNMIFKSNEPNGFEFNTATQEIVSFLLQEIVSKSDDVNEDTKAARNEQLSGTTFTSNKASLDNESLYPEGNKYEHELRRSHSAPPENRRSSTQELTKFSIEIKGKSNTTCAIYVINIENLRQVVTFLELWLPEKLEIKPRLMSEAEAQRANYKFEQLGCSNLSESEKLPQMTISSMILCPSEILRLQESLPAQNQNQTWHLTYSTYSDGFSLQNLYRKVAQYDEPFLFVMEDVSAIIFGAFITCVPRVCESTFIGNGLSWLFTFKNDFQRFTWSQKNDYFLQCTSACIVFGSGNGVFGLYIDDDLHRGRTERCDTYDNIPLTEEKDFVMRRLEVWSFI